MSSKESRDCACFLTFLFSMPIRVHTMGKKVLNNCISWLYILDIWCVCPGYFLWAPWDPLATVHHYSLCHMELIPGTSSNGSLALWLPIWFNHWVSFARDWKTEKNLFPHPPSLKVHQSLAMSLYQRPQLLSGEAMHLSEL